MHFWSSLLFLSSASIYGDDLSSNNYDTGFLTDLHGIAIEIMNNHPEAYKR